MIKYENSKKEKIKKFDYALLNEFLELILYKNQFFIILFFLKHFKRFKIIHDKDYSFCLFIVLFVLVMIFLLIGAIPMGIQKDRYFHRFWIEIVCQGNFPWQTIIIIHTAPILFIFSMTVTAHRSALFGMVLYICI